MDDFLSRVDIWVSIFEHLEFSLLVGVSVLLQHFMGLDSTLDPI
jgi:hypothetical protein